MYKLTESNLILRLSDNACIPPDPANTDYAEYLKWLSEGNTPLPVDPPSQAQIKKTMIDAIQSYMDKEANTHEYDTVGSLCNYTTSVAFGDEAANGVIFRDACWLKGIEIMNACTAGTRPIPTVDELLAEMPKMVWP